MLRAYKRNKKRTESERGQIIVSWYKYTTRQRDSIPGAQNVSRAFTLQSGVNIDLKENDRFKLRFRVSFTCLNTPLGMKLIYDNLSHTNA